MDSIDELETNSRVEDFVTRPGLGSTIQQFALRLIALSGFDLILLLLMAILLAYLVHYFDFSIRWLHPSMGLPLAIMASVLLMDFSEWIYFLTVHKTNRARKFLRQIPVILRDWSPFILIDFIYENLHDISGKLSSFDIAPWLYRWDVAIFGFEPTLATQKITTPWLTDLMAVLYAPYLAYPLILMALLSLANRRLEFQQISVAVIFTFLLGFTCYAAFPALPPRFYLVQLYTNPVNLNGSFVHDHLQNVWDQLSAVRGAAFPSLHVALSSIALFFAFRLRKISKIYRILFYAYLPLVPGLWFSTIYLRHHWFVDILAAWGICALAIFLSNKVNQLTWRLRTRFGISF
jgi:membrane-associated phospholipid phosphatase